LQPEFLTTRGVTSKIESTISNAKDTLVLISPYLNFIPEIFILKISKAVQNGVKVALIFRDFDNIHRNELEKIKSIKGLSVFQNQNVHAKAYYNEKEAVVTSFNLSGKSEQNNIEFGIYFTRKESEDMFEALVWETEHILADSNTRTVSLEDDDEGYCIRCNKIISINPTRPFCYSCYSTWSEFGDINYQEKFCHFCGTSKKTSMNHPICDDC
jgi:phosphatidylserine/phosphatidylglycerophosphate/cardiolipin synthase-like enzyme